MDWGGLEGTGGQSGYAAGEGQKKGKFFQLSEI